MLNHSHSTSRVTGTVVDFKARTSGHLENASTAIRNMDPEMGRRSPDALAAKAWRSRPKVATVQTEELLLQLNRPYKL